MEQWQRGQRQRQHEAREQRHNQQQHSPRQGTPKALARHLNGQHRRHGPLVRTIHCTTCCTVLASQLLAYGSTTHDYGDGNNLQEVSS